MTPSDPAQIAQAFLMAWAKGERETARGLCHDDLYFRGPIEEWHRADDHLDALAPVAGIIERLDIKQTVASGDDVIVVYDLVTDTPVGTAAIAEWNVIRDGRIAEIRAYFDSHPWRSAGFGGEVTQP